MPYNNDQLIARFVVKGLSGSDTSNLSEEEVDVLTDQVVKQFEEFKKTCDNTSKETQMKSIEKYFYKDESVISFARFKEIYKSFTLVHHEEDEEIDAYLYSNGLFDLEEITWEDLPGTIVQLSAHGHRETILSCDYENVMPIVNYLAKHMKFKPNV